MNQTIKKKLIISVTFSLLLLALSLLNIRLISIKDASSFATLKSSRFIALADGETTYKGPLCSNQSGTVYCCKGDSGDCSAGAQCTSCQ